MLRSVDVELIAQSGLGVLNGPEITLTLGRKLQTAASELYLLEYTCFYIGFVSLIKLCIKLRWWCCFGRMD